MENQANNHEGDNVCAVNLDEFSRLLESQPRNGFPSHRQIHKVSPQLRLKQRDSENVYDPLMVSLGPYHHRNPMLQRAQEFKHYCLDWCASGAEEKKALFFNKILENIDEIRRSYAETSILDRYDDNALALMMLLDGCFIINYMEVRTNKKNNFSEWRNCLGVAAAIPFAARDIVVLENQIPFLVIKHLLNLKYQIREEGEKLLSRFLSWMLLVELNQAKIPQEDEDPPLHILEACWRIVAEKQNNSSPDPRIRNKKKKDDQGHTSNLAHHVCRSATELKAKGIFFRPSASHCIKDVSFKSHAVYGQLQLPVRYVSEQTQVILSNMIAYEISPDTKTDLAVLSYANFMKSLIESPEDVKELQEKGIVFNRFADHEQVVKLFKDIDTFGLLNSDIFSDVTERIGEHCNSKAKTWIANLIHTRFQSPWTVMALLAASFLLVLTFLQTFFTIRPSKG